MPEIKIGLHVKPRFGARFQRGETAPRRRIPSYYEFATHTFGPDAALLEQRKFAAEEQILRFDRSPRSDRERNQADKVSQQSSDDLKERDHKCDHAHWIAAASSAPIVADRIFAEDSQRTQ